MKKVFILIFSLFITNFLVAQTPKIDLTLTVKTTSGAAMANTKVDFVEISTRDRVEATTDAKGVAHALIEGGKYWQIEILEIFMNQK